MGGDPPATGVGVLGAIEAGETLGDLLAGEQNRSGVDLGPMAPSTAGEKRYYFVIVMRFSRLVVGF